MDGEWWIGLVSAWSSNGTMDKKVIGSTDTRTTNHFHYACHDHGSGFAAAAAFATNTPLFGTTDAFGAVAVVKGFWGASAC